MGDGIDASPHRHLTTDLVSYHRVLRPSSSPRRWLGRLWSWTPDAEILDTALTPPQKVIDLILDLKLTGKNLKLT
jgi:hypothetical protein